MAVGWIPTTKALSGSECAAPQVGGSGGSREVQTHNNVWHHGKVLSPDSCTATGRFTSIQYLQESVSLWWQQCLGCKVKELRFNHGTFADDIALFATTRHRLQAFASELESQLYLCGLSTILAPSESSVSLLLRLVLVMTSKQSTYCQRNSVVHILVGEQLWAWWSHFLTKAAHCSWTILKVKRVASYTRLIKGSVC